MGMGIVWFNVPLDTFRSFRRRWVTAASARIIAAVSTEAIAPQRNPSGIIGGQPTPGDTIQGVTP